MRALVTGCCCGLKPLECQSRPAGMQLAHTNSHMQALRFGPSTYKAAAALCESSEPSKQCRASKEEAAATTSTHLC
jgi:hypothetical protein